MPANDEDRFLRVTAALPHVAGEGAALRDYAGGREPY